MVLIHEISFLEILEAQTNNINILKELLKINERRIHGQLLRNIAQYGTLELFKLIYELYPQVYEHTIEQGSPFSIACENGNLELVKYLHSKGKSGNDTSSDGFTPLYSSVFHGHKEVAKYLYYTCGIRDDDIDGNLQIN